LFNIKKKIGSSEELEKTDVLNIMPRDDSETLSKLFIKNMDDIKS